jgi:hypothetical protein
MQTDVERWQTLLAELPEIHKDHVFQLQRDLNKFLQGTHDRKTQRSAIAFTLHKVAYYSLSVDEILSRGPDPDGPALLPDWKSERWLARLLSYSIRALCDWPYPEHFDQLSPDDTFYILRRSLKPPVFRGGPIRLEWTRDRRVGFLDAYEAAKESVRGAVERVRPRDPLPVRVAALSAANETLHASDRLPQDIIEKVAARTDQKATAEAPSLQELALEVAARRFNTDLNSYLTKVLTQARKIKTQKRKH